MNKFYYYSYEHAEVLVFNNYLVNQIREGAIITTADVDSIAALIEAHFDEKPWVYISNRTASYSVDPMAYKRASDTKNLKGIAIVTQNASQRKMALFEQKFAEIPIVVLDELTAAFSWADAQCG